MTWPRRGSASTSPSTRRRASAPRIAALEKPKRATSCTSETGVPGASSSRTIAWRSRSWAAALDPAMAESMSSQSIDMSDGAC